MKIVRIYTGEDGESHFEDLQAPLHDSRLGSMSDWMASTGAMFRETSGSLVYDFHTAPRRQLVIALSGVVEIDCGNGEVRRLGAGDVLLADDTTGKGHISRDVEGPRRQIFVGLPDDLDLRPWGSMQ